LHPELQSNFTKGLFEAASAEWRGMYPVKKSLLGLLDDVSYPDKTFGNNF